ncbi:MAG: hypothetical protein KF826_03205 [Xanthobacteraceae bacterium]|nr:hypothetical protein [Xanthobacteraceae bacterium]MBX3520641.1 hypothetical protein [Xanthobacteraceae bacterium]MBX3523114.1 hypothetical protein [Xanthobacteraceae bacterium]MBX3533334.1 hypothetical protein [Xanthobacteraceae bacterium]MBX3548007.1 hypothetical protein [Xanthobacteraceae bacterium]
MRTIIVSSIFAAAFLVAGATAWTANAGVLGKGVSAASDTLTQTENVRCWRNAPYDGCGWGWRRTRWGKCRPC